MADISAEFPFESKFQDVLGSKMHYVEEGSGDPVLFLHGNPTSSYLWRNVIPHVSPLARCIAPDLIGFGKSDKPDLEYRFVDHAKYLDGFINALGLKNITFVVHDWGSGLGFYYANRNPSNVKGIAFMEAIIKQLTWDGWPPEAKEMFQGFRTPKVGWDLAVTRNLFVEAVLPGSILRKITDEEMNVYRQPFLEPESRKPVWRWPNEIPIEGQPEDVWKIAGDYWQFLQQSEIPKLLLAANPGAIMRKPLVDECREKLPNLTVVDIGPGSHFVQEDNPHGIGEAVAKWYQGIT